MMRFIQIITLGFVIGSSVPVMAAQPPALPDLKSFDADKARDRSNRMLDDAARAAQGGPVRAMPNIKTPSSGVDIAQIANRYGQARVQAEDERLLIFATLGMPQAALVKLARQAARAGAVMVFRGVDGGLAGGNWARSIEAFKPIAEAGASIQIHPELFKAYRVSQAPTFILTAPDQGDACVSDRAKACGKALRSVGDVSLDFVLERWSTGSGDLAEEARKRLARIEVRP
jgi:conjugal transfer pilus assembly protein TrbC